MGQCMPCIKQNASKIRIRRMELDKNLNMVCIIYIRSRLRRFHTISLLLAVL